MISVTLHLPHPVSVNPASDEYAPARHVPGVRAVQPAAASGGEVRLVVFGGQGLAYNVTEGRATSTLFNDVYLYSIANHTWYGADR